MGCLLATPESRTNDAIEQRINVDRKKEKGQFKILLLGPGESGKSTIFKQMKIIQVGGGFNKDELLEFKYIIFGNCISQMKVMVEAAIRLKIQLSDPANQARFEKFSTIHPSGDSWTKETAQDVKLLWSDRGIQEVYNLRSKEFHLNDSAAYFFTHIDRIVTENFTPTQDDLLRARVRTTGIQEAEFKFEDIEFRMLDVGGQRSERRKWIHCFDSVTAVIFCVALSEYDQTLREDPTQNRMKESLLLFDEVCNSHWFRTTAFILFLNKTDLFREKIEKQDLTICFPNYTGGCNYDNASKYIKERFEDQNQSSHSIFVHFTCAINTENIEFVFRCVRETVLQSIISKIVI